MDDMDFNAEDFRYWLDMANAYTQVRGNKDQAEQIAAVCWLNNKDGGYCPVWHAAALVHEYPCQCYGCRIRLSSDRLIRMDY